MGKRKIVSEDDLGKIQLPVANDVLGTAVEEKSLGSRGRHRSSFPLGLSIGCSRGYLWAVQKK